MPDIIIITQFPELSEVAVGARISGQAFASGRPDSIIGFVTEFKFDDSVHQINQKIIAAAIAELGRIEPPVTVTANDKKILFGAAT